MGVRMLSCFLGSKVLYKNTMNGFFSFNVSKSMDIEIWQLGLVYRIFQILVGLYFLFVLFMRDAMWTWHEVPMGSFNAYAGMSGAASIITAATGFGDPTTSGLKYCSNTSFSFDFGGGWDYGNLQNPPECRVFHVNEITTKGVDHFFFATHIAEKHYIGWACGDSTDSDQRSNCSDVGGTVTDYAYGQCECVHQDFYYPVGVENMSLTLEVGYDTTDKFKKDTKKVAGSVNVNEKYQDGDPDTGMFPLSWSVVDVDGNVRAQKNSGTISMTVGDWLEVAGVSLDAANHELGDGVHGPSGVCNATYCSAPRLRTAGVKVDLEMEFYNTDDGAPGTLAWRWDVLTEHHDVRMKIRAKQHTKEWTGLGARLEYEVNPRGPGLMTYHKIER